MHQWCRAPPHFLSTIVSVSVSIGRGVVRRWGPGVAHSGCRGWTGNTCADAALTLVWNVRGDQKGRGRVSVIVVIPPRWWPVVLNPPLWLPIPHHMDSTGQPAVGAGADTVSFRAPSPSPILSLVHGPPTKASPCPVPFPSLVPSPSPDLYLPPL